MWTMNPTIITSAATSCRTYPTSTVGRPKVFGNHIGMPEIKKITLLATIAQKYTFWPALKKSTYSGSSLSVFATYAFNRRIHRRSSLVHDIGCSQFSTCSAKHATNPRLNQGCSNRVMGPPPKSGVSQRYSHGV